MKHTDYLKKKKNREIRRRVISVLSALVVFVATYALVLPALTLDVKTARMEPGMSVQQEADPEAVTAPEAPAEEETVEESTKEEEPAEAVEPEKEEKSVKEESAKEDQSAQAEEQAPAEDASKDKADEATQKEDAGQADADSAAADQAPAKNDSSSEAVDQSGADAAEENTKEAAAEAFKVPELEAIDFNEILTDKTDFYYYHADKDEDAAAVSSTDIDDWKKVTEDTVLAPEDFVRVYLAYSIPAGALNETNATTTYRLPEGLELTDKQIKAINKNENGISGTDKDAKDYKKYLGAEAIEGTRTPDKTRGDDEYISATVKVEKAYENDKYVGQDLVFTFAPYTVQKNQISYDDKGNVTSEGKAVKGWFSFDLTPSRIDFEETEDAAAESGLVRSEAKITFVKENNKKDIDEISRALTLDAPAGTDADKTEEKAEQAAEQKSLTFEGADYTVVINYTEDAQIPDNAELAVSEIEKGTDEYNDYLKQAEDAVDEDKTVNEARFFDITILADGEKVEPAAPVSVQINFTGIEQTNAEDTQLLHYTEDEVQVMDKAEFSMSEESSGDTKAVDTVQFETDGFSVYGIVGTKIVAEITLPGSDDIYEVVVSYGPEANIPTNAKLDVTAIDPDSAVYKLTKAAVAAAKKAEDEDFIENNLGLAALDISIVDADTGGKVEPAEGAEVKVYLKLKQLPEVEDESILAETMEIQHLNNSTGSVVVETVAGSEKVRVADGIAEVEFKVDSFSTFGISWSTNVSTNLRWRYNNSTTRGQVAVNYVNHDGASIQRPGGVGDYYDVACTNWPENAEVLINNTNIARTYNNRNYERAYIVVDGTQKDITRILQTRTGDNEFRTDYYNNDALVHSAAGQNVTGYPRPDVYLQYSNTANENRTIVHYGYMDGNTFVEFEQEPDPTETKTSDGWAYLIYDFDGQDDGGRFEYRYANTYYHTQEVTNPKTGGTEVAPVLRYNQNAWRYYRVSNEYSTNALQNNNNWTSVGSESHLYVVYDKPIITDGGTPQLSDDTPTPDIPSILKESKENGDDTNTLSLSITGSTDEILVETLADVIVVLDLSSSMRSPLNNNNAINNYQNNSSSRYYQAMEAVEDLADDLYQMNTDSGKDLIRMGLITFGGVSQKQIDLTENKSSFIGALNAIGGVESKGTNWEQSLKMANEMAVDPHRATFVIFVTDGEPTTSQTRSGLDNDELRTGHMFQAGGQDGSVPGNYSYAGFTYSPLQYYLNTGTFGTTDANSGNTVTLTANAAYDDVQSMLDHDKNVYVIGISSQIVGKPSFDELIALVSEDHVKSATQEGQIAQAFNEIKEEITGKLGWGDIKMTDGITDLTNTVSKSPMVDFGTEFTYYKSTAPANWKNWSTAEKEAYQKGVEYAGKEETPEGYDSWSAEEKAAYQQGKNITFAEWSDEDRAAAHCEDAEYVAPSVVWNMGENFMLEDGVTYKVSFICWPSQQAYDILAKCRNDESYYDTLTPEQQGQIKRTGTPGNYSYTLKTNRDGANTTYRTATKTGNTVTPSGDPEKLYFQEVPDLHLSQEMIGVEKEWENEIDARKENQINLGILAGEDDIFTTISVKYDEDPDVSWKGSAYISTGLMKVESGRMTLYETGHDFSITENVPGGPGYRWELETETYRPMVITDPSHGYNQPTTVVLKKVTSSDQYDYDILERDQTTHSYYKIVPDAEAVLKAKNYRRSNLNLNKHVVDRNGNNADEKYADEPFEYTVTINNSLASTGAVEDPYSDHWVWFSVQKEEDIPKNDNWEIYQKPEVSGNVLKETRDRDSIPEGEIDSEAGTITYTENGKQYTVYLTEDGSGVYTGYYHVPSGEAFKVKLKPTWNLRVINLPKGSTYTFKESSKADFECMGSTLTTKYGQDDAVGPNPLSDDEKATGSIVNSNTEYTVSYTNKSTLLEITIIKTDDSDTRKKLGGAKFQLWRKNSNNIYEKIGEIFEIPKEGYTISGIEPGYYRLEEVIPPPDYIIIKKEIDFTVSDTDHVITLAEGSTETASVDEEDSSTMYIQNTPGVVLPNAGGPGTLLYTLSGLAMIVTALMYGFRMRRRERRLK